MRRRLTRFAPAVAAAAAKALYEGANEIMNASEPLVPVETGTLKASGRVGLPVMDGDTITVRAGYGYGDAYTERVHENDAGDRTGYAVYVHEDLTKKHAAPTQAKFLEQPAAELKTKIKANIVSDIRKAFRKAAAG